MSVIVSDLGNRQIPVERQPFYILLCGLCEVGGRQVSNIMNAGSSSCTHKYQPPNWSLVSKNNIRGVLAIP